MRIIILGTVQEMAKYVYIALYVKKIEFFLYNVSIKLYVYIQKVSITKRIY